MAKAGSRGHVCLRWMRRGCWVLAYLGAVGVADFLLLLSRPGTSLFSWHPFFMSIAFCLCLTEAILIFSPDSSLFLFCCCFRKVNTQLHWTLPTLALVVAALGLAFIVSSKNRSELSHFVSWHSIVGLLTFVAACGHILCGLCLRFPHLLRMSFISPLRQYHLMCGLIVYLLATFTVVLAICSDWVQAQIKGLVWYLSMGLLFCPALVIVNQVARTHLPKKGQCI
nr:probable transmembrane reductase CYB561D1 [Anolis sagrei ordinatus]